MFDDTMRRIQMDRVVAALATTTFVMGLLALLAVGPPVAARVGHEPPPEARIALSPTTGPPGTTIRASATGCGTPAFPARFVIELAQGDEVWQRYGRESTGDWEATLTIPADAAPGVWQVLAYCRPNDQEELDPRFDYQPTQFVVTAPTPDPRPSPDPEPSPEPQGSPPPQGPEPGGGGGGAEVASAPTPAASPSPGIGTTSASRRVLPLTGGRSAVLIAFGALGIVGGLHLVVLSGRDEDGWAPR